MRTPPWKAPIQQSAVLVCPGAVPRNGDGMIGDGTWLRMKALRAEREPFPRGPLTFDFDATLNAGACERHNHPAIDVDVPAGTPIPVVADGVVRYAGMVGRIVRCAAAVACQAGTGPAATCNFLSYGRATVER